MLESTPFEEEVKQFMDAIANDGADNCFYKPKNKITHRSHPLSETGPGVTA